MPQTEKMILSEEKGGVSCLNLGIYGGNRNKKVITEGKSGDTRHKTM